MNKNKPLASIIWLHNHDEAVGFGNVLSALGIAILSTGDNVFALQQAGLSVIEQGPDMSNASDYNIFLAAVSFPILKANPLEIEIDTDKIAILRKAASRYKECLVLSDEREYADIIAYLKSGNPVPLYIRTMLACTAICQIIKYDIQAAKWLEAKFQNAASKS